MLQNIRERLTGRVALVILGAIALSFIFVGGASFTTIGSSYVAKVDGSDISISQFESAYRSQLQSNPQLASLPLEFRIQLRKNIVEQLIQQQVIDNYLEELGFAISDDQLIEAIHQFPEFHSEGRFDKEIYLSYLESIAMTPATFEVSLKDNLRRSQLQRAIRGSTIVAPSAYRRYLNLAFEIRNVSISEITPESLATQINVTENMIINSYNENSTDYFLPESVDFDYIEINRNAVSFDLQVTEKQLMDYYLINQNRFMQDEQRRAQHILILFSDNEFEAEDTAIKLLERINLGESFSELAGKFSQDSATSDNEGDLGSLTLMQLPEALGEAVFSMKPGEIKGPIKGDFGFHLVRLNEILKSGPLPYEQVRNSLLSEMQEKQGEQLYLDLKRKLTDALFDATNIQQLADAFGGDVISVKDFKREDADPFYGNELAADLIFDPKLLDSLSSSNKPQLTDIIELDIDRTIVVSVFNHSIASRDSLENVKNQIIASLTQEQSDSLMAANSQKILQAVREGSEFETAALKVGAEITPSSPFIRNDQSIDQSLLETIFDTAKPVYGNPTFGSTPNSNGGYTVFRLDSVIAGQPELIPLSDRDNGRLEISNKTGLNDFIALVQALREKAEVKINEDVLAADGIF